MWSLARGTFGLKVGGSRPCFCRHVVSLDTKVYFFHVFSPHQPDVAPPQKLTSLAVGYLGHFENKITNA